MKAINFLNREYNKYGYQISMVISHLLSIGFNTAMNITDEELNNMLDELNEKEKTSSGISILSPEFSVWICTEARNVAKNVTPVELIQWCQMKQLFDTSLFEEDE